VCQFCEMADDLGLVIPNADDMHQKDDVIRLVANHCAISGQRISGLAHAYSPEPFAFAQHHRIPTSFLDWTRDGRVAAFFAADRWFYWPTKTSRPSEICVWATKPDRAYGVNPRWITVARGQHPFLHAQHGLFSFDQNSESFFWGNNDWPDFSEAPRCVSL
jgi:hypothetical protein